jgi:hypothetical protein
MRFSEYTRTQRWAIERGLPRPVTDLGTMEMVADPAGRWHLAMAGCGVGDPDDSVAHPVADLSALEVCHTCHAMEIRPLLTSTARLWFDDAHRVRSFEGLIESLEDGTADAAPALLRTYQRIIDPVLFVHSELRDTKAFEELRVRAESALRAAQTGVGESADSHSQRLVAFGAFDPASTDTADEIVAIVASHHHAPLEALGRVALVVSIEESATLRRWAESRGSVYWEDADPGLRLEAELEELWLDGVGGEHPAEAFLVLQALAA